MVRQCSAYSSSTVRRTRAIGSRSHVRGEILADCGVLGGHGSEARQLAQCVEGEEQRKPVAVDRCRWSFAVVSGEEGIEQGKRLVQ
jgi:hypothetical protein